MEAVDEYALGCGVGTEAGLRLCLAEVISVIVNGLSSSLWTIKAQAGAAACTVAEKLGSQLGPPHLAMLLTTLLNALPGRTWTGKVIYIVVFQTWFLCLTGFSFPGVIHVGPQENL